MKIGFSNILTSIMIFSLGITIITESFAQGIEYGIRTGINNTHKKDLDLSVFEIFLHTAPPVYSLMDNIFAPLNISFEIAFGMIREKTNSSLMFSMGPTLNLINYKNIFSVSTGLKPSLTTNHIFNNFDLGGTLNFKSHIAVNVSPNKKIILGYRLEHISNAGLYQKNPGLNIHYVEVIFVL
ncbi:MULTISPECIES: acyloxyacyl hydrolase [unclassified Melioribacter]|uniref:acyloxyacyl hydrolase n=1 Tax=unclassified Melioribacter TaxID=2627329 RepID=UPI003BBCB254